MAAVKTALKTLWPVRASGLDQFGYIRKELLFQRSFLRMASSSAGFEAHQNAVNGISIRVQEFYERKEKFRIFHGSTNSTRPRPGRTTNLVDTSALTHVLEIDPLRRTALVEPNVSMDRLVEATLKYDLIPPVVMEFPGITVGGGYAGTSGESSSFKHGFFDRTINYVEMVLGNGQVVKCSDTENSDLFHGAAGAVGTLGITTLVELRLEKAKKYVETTYHPVSDVKEAIETVKSATADPENDYVDGIVFPKNRGAIITGRLTDTPRQDSKVQTFSNARDPWFYLHVQNMVDKHSGPVTEAIPLPEYLFRYDRGGFWVGASAFDYFMVPSNKYTRWFLDDFLHTRMMYTALHTSGESDKYIVQDLALPYHSVEDFIQYCRHVFNIYPLWLCPLKQSPLPTMHPHMKATESSGDVPEPMLNVGLWGFGGSQRKNCIAMNKDLERKLRELGGMKWLYAQTFYTEEEFWDLFDEDWYHSLRVKYHATSLPTVYDKVCRDINGDRAKSQNSIGQTLFSIWPIPGLYGLFKAIQGGTYIQARAAAWRKPRQ